MVHEGQLEVTVIGGQEAGHIAAHCGDVGAVLAAQQEAIASVVYGAVQFKAGHLGEVLVHQFLVLAKRARRQHDGIGGDFVGSSVLALGYEAGNAARLVLYEVGNGSGVDDACALIGDAIHQELHGVAGAAGVHAGSEVGFCYTWGWCPWSSCRFLCWSSSPPSRPPR